MFFLTNGFKKLNVIVLKKDFDTQHQIQIVAPNTNSNPKWIIDLKAEMKHLKTVLRKHRRKLFTLDCKKILRYIESMTHKRKKNSKFY